MALAIQHRVAPRFETRQRHQETKTDHQGEHPKKRLLLCGKIAAHAKAFLPFAKLPSDFASKEDNDDANKENGEKGVVVKEMCHDRSTPGPDALKQLYRDHCNTAETPFMC